MALARLIPTEDSFADPSFSTAAISPDGTMLAYLAPKLVGPEKVEAYFGSITDAAGRHTPPSRPTDATALDED